MKRKKIWAIALLSVMLVASCQSKVAPVQEENQETVNLILGDYTDTKVTVDGSTGACTWTTGDDMAIYISGTGAGYYSKVINGEMVVISTTAGQARAGYGIYPAASAVAGRVTAEDLWVNYPDEYDYTGKTTETYTPMPMVAVNAPNTDLTFYNVGGVLRLTVKNVPVNTEYLKITFPGINITGYYKVANPGTETATLTYKERGTDNATIKIIKVTAKKEVIVNLPLPQGDYSTVTGNRIQVIAQDADKASLATVTTSISYWTTISRKKGKKLSVDFGPASFLISTAATTLWKSENVTFETSGSGYTYSWTSGNDAVATVDGNGVVTAKGKGSTTITASINSGLASASQTVYVNEVTSVAVAVTTTPIAVGGTTAVTADLTLNSGAATNGTILYYPPVTWTSSETSYVTVPSQTSLVITATGVAAGTSSVTATIAGDYTTSGSAASGSADVVVE